MAIVYGNLSFAETSGSSVTVDKPTGLAVGDYILAIVTGSSASANTWNPPSGFSAIQNTFTANGGGDLSLQSFWKIATQADVDATTFTFTGTLGGTMNVTMLYVTGATGAVPTYAVNTVTANNTVTTAGITPSANSFLVIVGACSDDEAATLTQGSYAVVTSDPTWTERQDNFNASSNVSVAVATAIRPQATATSTSTVVATPSAGTVDVYTQVIFAIAPTTTFTLTAETGSFSMTGNDAILTYFSPDLLNTSKPSTSINNTAKP